MSAAEKLTNTMGGDRPRNAMDFYPTPDGLAEAICRRLREAIGDVERIIEPSAGAGPFVRSAAERWPSAVITAVEPRADDPAVSARLRLMGAKIVLPKTWEECEAPIPGASLIVGNPPFLQAEEHVRLALSRLGHGASSGPQPRWLAFLLRASFLASAKRRALFEDLGGLRHVWHVIGRPSFTGDGKTDGAEYAVLVWHANYRGPYEGGWLTWK